MEKACKLGYGVTGYCGWLSWLYYDFLHRGGLSNCTFTSRLPTLFFFLGQDYCVSEWIRGTVKCGRSFCPESSSDSVTSLPECLRPNVTERHESNHYWWRHYMALSRGRPEYLEVALKYCRFIAPREL
jgi:hypothetical protein